MQGTATVFDFRRFENQRIVSPNGKINASVLTGDRSVVAKLEEVSCTGVGAIFQFRGRYSYCVLVVEAGESSFHFLLSWRFDSR